MKRGAVDVLNKAMFEFSIESEERLSLRDRREEEREMSSDVPERDMPFSVSLDAPSTSKREAVSPLNEEPTVREMYSWMNVVRCLR